MSVTVSWSVPTTMHHDFHAYPGALPWGSPLCTTCTPRSTPAEPVTVLEWYEDAMRTERPVTTIKREATAYRTVNGCIHAWNGDNTVTVYGLLHPLEDGDAFRLDTYPINEATYREFVNATRRDENTY